MRAIYLSCLALAVAAPAPAAEPGPGDKARAAWAWAKALRELAPAPAPVVPKGPCSELCSCGCQDGRECTCHLLPTTKTSEPGIVPWHVAAYYGFAIHGEEEGRIYYGVSNRVYSLRTDGPVFDT